MSDQVPVFPMRRPDPHTPPDYRLADGSELRRCPLSYGGEAWLVTGQRAAREILADSTSFSSDALNPGFPAFPLASKRPIPGHFLSMDPPEHSRLRRLVAEEFTARRVRRTRPEIDATVSALIDDLVSGGSLGDIVSSVAIPLPGVTSSQILGTPVADRDFFIDCVRRMQRHDASYAQRTAAAGHLNRYLERLVTAKRQDPGTDLLSRLARAIDEEQVGMAEVIGMANLIVVAGLETTAGLTYLSILSLLTHPEQAELVRADPARWSGPAVAEALRYWTVVQHGVARVATRDVEVAGRAIRTGDGVVISLPVVNRDPSVYPDPDRFDITRTVQGQLAFGHGAHRCLGSFVAQAQTESAVAQLLTRLPGLRLAVAPEQLSFLDEMLIYGLRALPVEW